MTGVLIPSSRPPRSSGGLLVQLVAAVVLGAPGALAAQEAWPIDRWLVAEAPADTTSDFAVDLLESPGETGVLPDRGRPAGGVTWQLVREDGAAFFSLDSILDDPAAGTVAYVHAYVRLPSDRTLWLRWDGTDCTRTGAWLNGRAVDGGDPQGARVPARFGSGWNTVLLKLRAGDCPFGFRASLETAGDAVGGDAPRIQASRPYGDVRTGPKDWIVPADSARIADERRWRDDRLYAGLAVELTAWARAAVADVELELHDGLEGRATAAWLVPATPVPVVVPVRLDRLASGAAVELRLSWGEEESEHRVVVTGSRPGPTSPVVLDGWDVIRSPGDVTDTRSNTRLPNGPEWRLEGEWEVPEALAGRSLTLDVESAPADYVVNGSPAAAGGGEITLCAPCSRGVELRLAAVSTDAWTSLPVVRVAP